MKIVALYQTVFNIKNDEALSSEYIREIKQIKPSKKYMKIALNAVEYLAMFLDNYISAYNMNIELDMEEFMAIEKDVYEIIVISNN